MRADRVAPVRGPLRRLATARRAAVVAVTLALLASRASVAAAQASPQRDIAAPAASAGSTAAPAGPGPATLAVGGRTVVTFRATIGVLSPAARAAAARARIDSLLDAGVTDSVEVRRIPEGVEIVAAGAPVFALTRADADSATGETLDDAAHAAAARLRGALAGAAEVRSLPHLAKAIGLAILATLLFLVVLRLIREIRHRLRVRLRAIRHGGIRDITVGTFTLFSGASIVHLAERAVDLVAWGGGLFLGYLWVAYVLTRFAYSRPWGEALGTYLRTALGSAVLSVLGAIPGLFAVVVILVVARWVARVVGAFFDAVEGGGVQLTWLHPEIASPTKRIVIALLWMFAIIIAYPYVPGSGSDVFKGVSVFAGVVLSLGSSGIMNQAMSGLVLMYARALRPGDYVRIGDTEGTVIELGLLSTKIRTKKQEQVTLPNAVVVAATVKNFSRAGAAPGVLLHTSVTIGYDTPWRQVRELLLMAAARTPGLRREPPPFVLQTNLGDFYIEYQLDAYIEAPEQRIEVLSALHANIADCFNEYGVQIMSPHYVLDPHRAKVVPTDRWYAAPARVTPPEEPPSAEAP